MAALSVTLQSMSKLVILEVALDLIRNGYISIKSLLKIIRGMNT